MEKFSDELIPDLHTNNVTIMNTIYHKPEKNSKGEFSEAQIDLVYKNNDTGEKKVHTIMNPDYEYFVLNDDVPMSSYPKDFINMTDVHPVRCPSTQVLRSIAQETNNMEFFYENIKNGNYGANKQLLLHPKIFNADMNISDHYRYRFNKRYDNPVVPISKMFFDIECDTINMRGDFPELGECPVNAISCIFGDKVISFVVRDYNNPSMIAFEKEVNQDKKKVEKEFIDFIQHHVGGKDPDIYEARLKFFDLLNFGIEFRFYDSEMECIEDFFRVVNTLKPDFVLAWNMAFDTPTLIERIRKNGLKPEDIICPKDFINPKCDYFIDTKHTDYEERGDYSDISGFSTWVCQMIQFASRRKGQSAIENFKIDYIGELITGVKKLDYSHICKDIRYFPTANFKMFVLYNIVDTIVQKCIEQRVQDIEYLFTNAIMFNTRYSKTHRQSIYLSNKRTQAYWDGGYVVGDNSNIFETKKKFSGGFVADLTRINNYAREFINRKPLRLFKNLCDYDYTALYPSLYREWNMCKNGMIAQIHLLEPQKYEDRFKVEAYNRSNAFAQNYHCKNYIDFGHRWFNLPDYRSLYNHIKEFYSTHSCIYGNTRTDYFDKSRDNCIYAFPSRKKKNEITLPTRTALQYTEKHTIRPYKKFTGDMSAVFDEQSKSVFQNRPDVVIKKIEIGVDVL